MRVSVITVCFNSEKYITDAINSVNSQSYEEIEHIFIDGGSTDETLNIISTSVTKKKVVVSEPDDGIYDAMNKGVRLSTGDIICFLNSDDQYTDGEVISDVVRCFQTEGKPVSIVHGAIRYFDSSKKRKTNRLWRAKHIQESDLRKGAIPPHPATFLKKEVILLVGPFDIRYEIASDFDLIKRVLVNQNYEQRIINRVLVNMRLGGLSTSGITALIRQNREIFHSLRTTFPDLNGAHFFMFKFVEKLKQFWS